VRLGIRLVLAIFAGLSVGYLIWAVIPELPAWTGAVVGAAFAVGAFRLTGGRR